MTNKEQLVIHLNRLVAVVRSVQMKRALSEVCPEPTLVYWQVIHGDLLDVAVVEWCKIFGADREPTHWKKVVDDHDSFRRELLTFVGVDDATWSEYWKTMKAYRDAEVAHKFKNPDLTHYPSLEIALQSSYFYYSYLIGKLRAQAEVLYPNDLKTYAQLFLEQAKSISRLAIDATATLEETLI